MINTGTAAMTIGDIKEETKQSDSGEGCCGWFLQIFLWIMMIILFYEVLTLNLSLYTAIILFIVYLLYIFNSFSGSTTNYYLKNSKKTEHIQSYVYRLFNFKPVVKFKLENYHYSYDSKGRKGSKQISSTHHKEMDLLSWRDTSGEFIINFENSKKTYLKLHLKTVLTFADDGSEENYRKQKESFKKDNKTDVEFDFSEERTLEGFEEFVLLRLKDRENTYINSMLYFIFTICIPCVEIYKLYIEKDCETKNFTINKLLSTNTNLTTIEFDKKYFSQNPKLIFNKSNLVLELSNNSKPVDLNIQDNNLKESLLKNN
jgi:hypothetical protein